MQVHGSPNGVDTEKEDGECIKDVSIPVLFARPNISFGASIHVKLEKL